MNKLLKETIRTGEAEGLKFCGVESRSKHMFAVFENKKVSYGLRVLLSFMFLISFHVFDCFINIWIDFLYFGETWFICKWLWFYIRKALWNYL